jgi:hypothetical protein
MAHTSCAPASCISCVPSLCTVNDRVYLLRYTYITLAVGRPETLVELA